MDNSEPLEKALTLLEDLSRTGGEPQTVAGLVRSTGIAKSTLVRMLNTLEERGYLLRDGGGYAAEFSFLKTLPLEGGERARIRGLCRDLHERTGRQIELIGVSGRDLYWHEAFGDPNAPVRVQAGPGFRRTLYELDAPARLYLAQSDRSALEERFDSDGFYFTGPDYRRASRAETAAVLAETELEACAFDREGNSNGIRRFAVLLRCGGSFLAVLALAEAATPRKDPARHERETARLLLDARELIEASAAQGEKP